MNKDEIINYINKIKPYINLYSICKLYNSNTKNIIDYNNLRVVLNGKSYTRLSEERLKNFLRFLQETLYGNIFEINDVRSDLKKQVIENIIDKNLKNMTNELIGVINGEISNK